MTPEEFITGLFGEGWTESQLPVFLTMLMAAQEDAKRYYEIRDILAGDRFIPSRKSLESVDDMADAGRYCGIV